MTAVGMKVIVKDCNDFTLDDQSTRPAVDCEQFPEVGRTVERAVTAVELLRRQLPGTFYYTQTNNLFCMRQYKTHAVLTE